MSVLIFVFPTVLFIISITFFQIRVFLFSKFLLSVVHFFVEVLPSLLVVQLPFFYDGFLSLEVGYY